MQLVALCNNTVPGAGLEGGSKQKLGDDSPFSAAASRRLLEGPSWLDVPELNDGGAVRVIPRMLAGADLLPFLLSALKCC